MKKWYSAVATALLSGVLFFLLLNLIFYFVVAHRKPQTPYEAYGGDKLLQAYPGWSKQDVEELLTETWGGDAVFEYEPFTGFRNKPLPKKSRYVNINPAGFRISRNQAPWPPPPGSNDVFVFGGSTTFGLGVTDEETIPSYLQECSPGGEHLAVYNFGRTWYYSSQELILFLQLLKAGYIPRVAVFIDGLNEFNSWGADEPANASALRLFMAGQAPSNPLDSIPMIKAAHWLGQRWKPHSPRNIQYDDRTILQRIADRWLANKKIIELVAGGYGVRPIFVWQPVPTYKYDLRYHFLGHPDSWYIERWPHGRYGYQLMEELREQGKLGPDLLWLADMQQDRHENLYVDKWHYNAAFSREIAARICEVLSNGGPPPQTQRAQHRPGHGAQHARLKHGA